jgi:beta-glucosidase-like glycosyl hydrolase
MTLQEKIRQAVTNGAPAIPRLGVQEYTYWSEALNGVVSLGDSQHAGAGNGVNNLASTIFPSNLAVVSSWDPSVSYAKGSAISDEARGFLDKSLFNVSQNNLGPLASDYGALTFFAPTVNMGRDTLWGRNDEAFGEDPYLAGQMSGQFVDGFQGENPDGTMMNKYFKAVATAKHYALNEVEDSRQGISSDVSDTQLRDYYTTVFRNLIEQAHVGGVMTSYNAINGTPAVADTYTINELARVTDGFRGYVTSDCGGVSTTYKQPPAGHNWAPSGYAVGGSPEAPVWLDATTQQSISAPAGGQAMVLRAGNDLNCSGDEMTAANVEEAINAGLLSEGVLDNDLVDVFATRMETGEFDPAGSVAWTSLDKSQIQSPAHQALATKVADESLVLLKNDSAARIGKPVLPATAGSLNKVVVLGDLANTVQQGSYAGHPAFSVSPLQGITNAVKAANPNATVVYDPASTSSTSAGPAVLSAATKSAVESADLVLVVVGTDHATAGEGNDRNNMNLSGSYTSLMDQVAALGNVRTALDIQAVGAVNIASELPEFSSVLFSVYNGENQGTALADVLFGKQNPQGRLPFTWYKDDSQLAPKNDYGLIPAESGGLGQTYQYFTQTPQFPFGYGLSYSTFSFSPAQVDRTSVTADGTVNVSFDVRNTGSTAGATVAQLYAAPTFGVTGVQLPRTRLMGFKNTGVLQPGASTHVSVAVPMTSLSRWDPTTSREKVDDGAYEFNVSSNSGTVLSTAMVNVTGTIAPTVQAVTVQPDQVVFQAGQTLDLTKTNPWLKDDTDPAQEHRDNSITADHIVEAVNNDQSMVDLSTTPVTYASSNPKVAMVSAGGQLTAVSDGVATISATVGGVTGSTAIAVQGGLTVKVPPTSQPGQPTTVTTNVTNPSSTPLANVNVSLATPSGWTVQATTPTTFSNVSAGSLATTTWRLTPPSGVAPGNVPLSATATYTGGSYAASAKLHVPFASQQAAFTTVGVVDDNNPGAANYDGNNAYSAQTLTPAGISPGTPVVSGNLTYQWPSAAVGTKDAIDAAGQAITVSGSGDYLGLLGSSTSGPAVGVGTVIYTDGSTQGFGLTFPDWVSPDQLQGSQTAATFTYNDNKNSGPNAPHPVHLFTDAVRLQSGKTVQTVILPDTTASVLNNRTGHAHVFAIAVGGTAPHTVPQPTGVTGRVVGLGGQCLDLAGGAAVAGGRVVLNHCDASRPSQTWTLGVNKTLWNNGWCTIPSSGATAVGTKIVLDTCDGSSSRQWTAQASGELVNGASNTCLDDPSNSLTDGTAQQLFTCSNGAAEEQYLVPPASKDTPTAQPAGPKGNLTEANGKCLVPAGGTAHVGAGIVVGECDTIGAQGWVASSSGQLWNGGYCATVYNGNTGSGTRASLASCASGAALQTWTTDSGKHLINGQSKTCMFDNSNGTDGSTIAMFGCFASAQQAFSLPAASSTPTLPGHPDTISIKANNGLFVTADDAGASPLIANRTSVGTWEKFDVTYLSGDQIQLRSEANGLYVDAPNAGVNPLIANQKTAASWATFHLIANPDGTYSLQSEANTEFVTSQNGAGPLIANQSTNNGWERFTIAPA